MQDRPEDLFFKVCDPIDPQQGRGDECATFGAGQFREQSAVCTGFGDMGRDANGEPKATFTPGYELHARYTIFAEGCRGHLGKRLMQRFDLQSQADPQHYGIGIKEIWDIDPAKHEQGLVVHTAGWPLNDENPGGSFLYHLENNQVVVGLIVDLSYSNAYLSPFDEFQRVRRPANPRLEGRTRIRVHPYMLSGQRLLPPGIRRIANVRNGCTRKIEGATVIATHDFHDVRRGERADRNRDGGGPDGRQPVGNDGDRARQGRA